MDGSVSTLTGTSFDTNMASIKAGETINILAGTFPTHGDFAWGPKTGMQILGAGMTLTKLQFPSNFVNSGSSLAARVIGVQSPYHQTNILVANLTLDANYQTGVVTTLDGLALANSGNTVSNVMFINGASFTSASTNYQEGWGLIISGNTTIDADWGGNLITGCIVSNFTSNFGNNQQAVGIIEQTSGLITNCVVYQATNAQGVDAFAPSVHDTTIANCSSFECVEVTHADTDIGFTNITYSHCNFSDCVIAFDYENTHVTNLVVDSCSVLLTNDIHGFIGNQALIYSPTSSTNQNFTVVNNTVTANGALSSGTFLNIANVNGLYSCGNSYGTLTNNFGAGVFNVTGCSPAPNIFPGVPNR